MMIAQYSVSEIKDILNPILTEYGVRRAVLFGSYAKGYATAQSDIDLLVDSGLRGLSFFGLLESVSSAFRQPVDLIDVTQVENGSEIQREIHNRGCKSLDNRDTAGLRYLPDVCYLYDVLAYFLFASLSMKENSDYGK